ncbi:hypothetical protein [Thalassolituus hydrocarboniclasticus]|uniref:Acetoacetate decarboxylase (ADC) n=1 Tax=Thalassolituus hydrocarboniclasticus TaxID=2742796 RepID=A0ABY6AFK9_9GAMM|nr:hypothetical protein [Thalassolituus hydrocarboniclasticus]UXD88600.1 acetoacetate decarboxylase (ADC) [Thalassolituus hydrocarboniclasticus]
MNIRTFAVVAGMAFGSISGAAVADNVGALSAEQSTMIDLGGHEVPVLKGGLYDRYRSNPPLSVVEQERPDIDLSWFKTLSKSKADMGFESWSPNFYYQNSRTTAVFTADINKLRELMPAEVLEQVQPLQIWPGRGVVALTAYTYFYCDNDSYNEIALSVITNKPGHSSFGPLTLAGQSMNHDFWGYVLKLPVNTELARVRGVVGYNLPKWKTDINLRETNDSVIYEVMDADTGKVDFVFETEKLTDLSSEPQYARNSYTNLNHQGELSTGYADSVQTSYASTSDSDAVKLQLSDGSFSRYIKALDLGKMMKYEYVPEFQVALYAPQTLKSYLASE